MRARGNRSRQAFGLQAAYVSSTTTVSSIFGVTLRPRALITRRALRPQCLTRNRNSAVERQPPVHRTSERQGPSGEVPSLRISLEFCAVFAGGLLQNPRVLRTSWNPAACRRVDRRVPGLVCGKPGPGRTTAGRVREAQSRRAGRDGDGSLDVPKVSMSPPSGPTRLHWRRLRGLALLRHVALAALALVTTEHFRWVLWIDQDQERRD